MTVMHDGGATIAPRPAPQTGVVGTTCSADDERAILTSWLHSRSPYSTHAYQANIARFLAHVDKPLAAVTLADLQGYADTLAAVGLAPASQARMLAVAKSLLTFAHTTGYLTYNPGRGLRLPGVRGRLAERIPSEEDILSLLAHKPNRRNHTLIRLCHPAFSPHWLRHAHAGHARPSDGVGTYLPI